MKRIVRLRNTDGVLEILVITISVLNQGSDKPDMKQIRSAGTGPAWNTEVDQWTAATRTVK